jgi:hypothetical protein
MEQNTTKKRSENTMTLAETLSSKLAEWRPSAPGQSKVSEADPATGWSASLTVEKADALSCQLSELAVSRSSGRYETKTWAESLTRRVKGLLEPLRVVEIDAQRDEAVLRSDAPTVRNDRRAHYELRLRGGNSATLTRFTAATAPAAKREPANFTLTHEVIAKLVDDLTAPV